MNNIRRRPKGTAPIRRPEDPDIIAVLDQISVLTPRERELKALFEYLIEHELLEVVEGTELDQLAIHAAVALDEVRGFRARAAALSEWLLEQEGVEDLYVDDEALARLLEVR
ncbi:MAG: hypothetical protein ABIO70_33970 [Pseudomonadota bacterium]